MPLIKGDLSNYSKCSIREHNHKYFNCDQCCMNFDIRDDSKLNVCFRCQLFLCDECCEEHSIDMNEFAKCTGGCGGIYTSMDDLKSLDVSNLHTEYLCDECYSKISKEEIEIDRQQKLEKNIK